MIRRPRRRCSSRGSPAGDTKVKTGRVGSRSLRSLAVNRPYQAVRDEKAIQERALRLLRSWLSPQQRAEFNARVYFDVVGCDGGERYGIRRGTSGNVNEIDGHGRLGTGWSFVPLCGLVKGDVMRAQKIALETNEQRAISFPSPNQVAATGQSSLRGES